MRNFNDKIEKMGDRIAYYNKGLRVEVLLCPHPKTATTKWADLEPPFGNLAVYVYADEQLLDDERIIMVKLPHHVHEYDTTWSFVTQRAHDLAANSIDRVIKRLWGVLQQ